MAGTHDKPAGRADAGYAAAVQDNPAYPYDSDEERTIARSRRNAKPGDQSDPDARPGLPQHR
jgi:hypothetical protein